MLVAAFILFSVSEDIAVEVNVGVGVDVGSRDRFLKTNLCSRPSLGPMLFIKYFCRKNSQKLWRFLLKLLVVFPKI
jgi:hypothetical protein